MSPEIIALVLVALAVGASLLPLLREEEQPAPVTDTAGYDAEKDTIVRALRDLDMDLALGRMSADEHAVARDGLEARALDVMARLEEGTAESSGEPVG